MFTRRENNNMGMNMGMISPMVRGMNNMNFMNMMNNMNMNNNMSMNQICPMANSYSNSQKIESDSQNTSKNTDELKSLNNKGENEKKSISSGNKDKETSKIKNNNLTLENLIMNQDIIEGSWTENDVTKQLIDIISKNKFDYISREMKKLDEGEIEEKIIYTIMVIYYLKTHYSSKINEYKLVINKAIKFLLSHGINYDDIQL